MQKWVMLSLVILLLSLLIAQTIFAAEEFVYTLDEKKIVSSIDDGRYRNKPIGEQPRCKIDAKNADQSDPTPALLGGRASLSMASIMTWDIPRMVKIGAPFSVVLSGSGTVIRMGNVEGGSTHSATVSISSPLKVDPFEKYFSVVGETIPNYRVQPPTFANIITKKPSDRLKYTITPHANTEKLEKFDVTVSISGPCRGFVTFSYAKTKKPTCKDNFVLDWMTGECVCKDTKAKKTITCDTSCVTDADCPDPLPEKTWAPRGHKCALVQGKKACVWDLGGNRFTFDGGCPGNKGTLEKPEPVCHPTLHTCIDSKVQRGTQTETKGMCILKCPKQKEECVTCTKKEAGTKVAASFENLKALLSEEISLRENARRRGSSTLDFYNSVWGLKR